MKLVAEKGQEMPFLSNEEKEKWIEDYVEIETTGASSAKTISPSLNLFILLYPQTQKNEIEVSLKYRITLLFQGVH